MKDILERTYKRMNKKKSSSVIQEVRRKFNKTFLVYSLIIAGLTAGGVYYNYKLNEKLENKIEKYDTLNYYKADYKLKEYVPEGIKLSNKLDKNIEYLIYVNKRNKTLELIDKDKEKVIYYAYCGCSSMEEIYKKFKTKEGLFKIRKVEGLKKRNLKERDYNEIPFSFVIGDNYKILGVKEKDDLKRINKGENCSIGNIKVDELDLKEIYKVIGKDLNNTIVAVVGYPK